MKRTGYCEVLGWVDEKYQELDDERITDPELLDLSEADVIILGIQDYVEFDTVRERLVRERHVPREKVYVNTVPFEIN